MKRILLVLFVLAIIAPIYGQNITYNSTNKYHRISTPDGVIDIGARNTNWAHIYTNRPKFIFDKPVYIIGGKLSGYNNSDLFLQTNGTTRMTMLKSNGNVGIGTSSPEEKIDVIGNGQFSGSISIKKSSYTKIQLSTHDWSGSHAILFNAYKSITTNGGLNIEGNTKYANNEGNYGGGAGGLIFNSNGGTMDILISQAAGSTGMNTNVRWGIPKVRINRSGEVGIGTTDIDGYRLSVAGTIRAEEIKVLASPWPDYVFTPSYNLRSLRETEQYIKENHHLPEIPSAEEVEEEGISLGEMNALLLKKIEELTLYLIEQEKKLKNQESLEEKVEELIERIVKIENTER